MATAEIERCLTRLSAALERIEAALAGTTSALPPAAAERAASGPLPAARGRAGAGGDPGQAGSVSLRRTGELWTLATAAGQVHLRDRVGLGLLARLVAEPRREFHALDLISPHRRHRAEGDGGLLLDAQARAAYRSRLQELAAEIEEAEAWGDPERAARARREVDLLTDQLAGAVGLGGRDRRVAGAAERARVSVTKALRGAVRRIAEHDPALGGHLEVSVRTGTFCAYCPDPSTAVTWTL